VGTVKKIKKAVRQVREVKPPAEENASDPLGLPTYDERYAVIRERSQELDPLIQWEKIRAWIKEEPQSIKEIRDLVKQHADMAERSKRLGNAADTELKLFELKCRDRQQIWRVAAMAHWESEKEAGNVTKQITEKMIEDWVIEQHGDLYIELETRRIQLSEVRDQLKALASQVSAQGQNLRKLLESETRRPSGTPNWMDDEKR